MDQDLVWDADDPSAPLFDVVLRGYDRHQVHELFKRIQDTLDGTANDLQRVTPDVLRTLQFAVVLRGYSRPQVHEALIDCMRRLQSDDS